jgi:hypothetical protein
MQNPSCSYSGWIVIEMSNVDWFRDISYLRSGVIWVVQALWLTAHIFNTIRLSGFSLVGIGFCWKLKSYIYLSWWHHLWRLQSRNETGSKDGCFFVFLFLSFFALSVLSGKSLLGAIFFRRLIIYPQKKSPWLTATAKFKRHLVKRL